MHILFSILLFVVGWLLVGFTVASFMYLSDRGKDEHPERCLADGSPDLFVEIMFIWPIALFVWFFVILEDIFEVWVKFLNGSKKD